MKLPRIPSWLVTVAGAVTALLIGFLLGQGGSDQTKQSSASSNQRPDRERPVLRSRDAEVQGVEEISRSGSISRGVDAQSQIQDILESTSRLERTQKLIAFLDRLPTDKFAEVYATISESPNAALRGSERSLVLQAWAEREPLDALGYLQENGAEDWERETTVSTWATTDPEGAFQWASNADDEGRINNWVTGALRGIAATDPHLARDYLVQMESGDTRERGLRNMERYITQFGFDYASDWIEGVDDDGLRTRASRHFADELVELDPTRAGEWNAAIADRNTRREVSKTVSDRWARQDLEAAREWVDGLPEDTRTEAAEGVARHYARTNPAEAASWLSGLGDNPDLDGARQVLIQESFRRDPEVSLNYVSNLSNARTRQGLYNRYLGNWMRDDAEAAKQWTSDNAEILPKNLVNRYLR